MKESNVHFLCPDCHIHGACAHRDKHDHQPSKCLLGTAPPHAAATDANDRTASARARAYRHPAAEGRQGAFYPALSQWRARSSGSRDFACEIGPLRSEEHTSELQSLMRISYAVFCLKKKTKQQLY